jgi:hypothetical protein
MKIAPIVISLSRNELKKVKALCKKLNTTPEQLVHVLALGSIDDHLSDPIVTETLRAEIAARFP